MKGHLVIDVCGCWGEGGGGRGREGREGGGRGWREGDGWGREEGGRSRERRVKREGMTKSAHN